MSRKTTWKQLILDEMSGYEESLDDMEECTLEDDEWDREFDKSEPFFCAEGYVPFTLWTYSRIYFPYFYEDEKEYCYCCKSVPRNPCEEKTNLF